LAQGLLSYQESHSGLWRFTELLASVTCLHSERGAARLHSEKHWIACLVRHAGALRLHRFSYRDTKAVAGTLQFMQEFTETLPFQLRDTESVHCLARRTKT